MQPPPLPPQVPQTSQRSNRVWLAFRDGQFEIRGLREWYAHWRDPYYLLLMAPWPSFLGLMVAAFFIVNTTFAVAYLLGGDCIIGAKPGSFWDTFFFSVQTLSSIGYGVMSPETTYAHAIATVEAMIGILSIALMTGLAFARFSKPTAQVTFSKVATIACQDCVPTLMFRVMNQRLNRILEAQIGIYFSRDETTAEGRFIRRFHELKLLRCHTPTFALPWTVMHAIDAESPLYGLAPADLARTKATIVASLTGVDETVAQNIHAHYTYGVNQLLWNYRFVDMIRDSGSGHRYIDFNCFHEAIPDEAATVEGNRPEEDRLR